MCLSVLRFVWCVVVWVVRLLVCLLMWFAGLVCSVCLLGALGCSLNMFVWLLDCVHGGICCVCLVALCV